jgi:hypothetical protein
MTFVSLQYLGTAATELKVIVPVVAPKPVPSSSTTEPIGPEVGLRPLILGVTVKVTPLLVKVPTVTVTNPVVARVGTATVIAVAVQGLPEPATLLKETELPAGDVPKFEPCTTTAVPVTPDVADRLVMTGACANNA